MRSSLPWIAVAILFVLQLASWLGPDESGAADAASAAVLARIDARLDALEQGLALRPAALPSPTSERDVERRSALEIPVENAGRDQVAARLAALERRLDALSSLSAEPGDDWRRDRASLRRLTDALASGDRATVFELLDSGVDPDARDDEGQTPLAAAAVAGDAEMVDVLLSYGATLERLSGRRMMTPLLAALDAVQPEAALRLLEHGASATAVDKNGESALIWASFNGCDAVVQQLLSQGVGVDFQSHGGGTALMDAARKGRLDVARMLLDHGADPNLADESGNTPLSFAGREGHADLAQLLGLYGALDP